MKKIYFQHFKSFSELKTWQESTSEKFKSDFQIINVQYNETGFYQGFLLYYFLIT
jgi:hypothetical protein